MALKLPTVADMGPRSTPRTRPGIVRGDSGEATSRALGGLGRSLVEAGERFQDGADEAAVQDAQVRFNQFEAERIHDPEKGAKARLGKDAFGLEKSLPEEFDRFRDDVMKGLTSNRARSIVGKIADSRRDQVATWAAGHVGEQRRVYEDGAAEAAIVSSIERVGMDPNTLEQELRNQSLAIKARLTKRGRAPEEIDVAVRGLQTTMHGSVVDGMIARGQYDAARAYFDKNTAAFGAKADEYGRRTIAAVEHAEAVKERRIVQAERDTRRNASKLIEESDPTQPVDVVLKPLLGSINAQPGLRDALERRQRERLQGLEVQTDPRERERLRTLMGRDPQAFLKTDITLSYPKLAIADRDYFENQQKAFADPAKQAKFATEAQLLGQAYDEMKIPGGEKGMAARGKFEGLYLGEKQAFVQQHKREPTADEMASMIKTLKLPFVKEGFFSDTTKRLYDIDPADPDFKVPEAERAAIVKRNADRGYPALTEQQIRQAYILRTHQK